MPIGTATYRRRKAIELHRLDQRQDRRGPGAGLRRGALALQAPSPIAATFRYGAHKAKEDARLGFDAYHILLVSLGASLLVSYWLPHLFVRRPPAATALLLACGMAGSLLFPRIVAGIDPTENPAVLALAAELVVIVVLFATVLRIDDLAGRRRWWPTIRLLAITSAGWPSMGGAGLGRSTTWDTRARTWRLSTRGRSWRSSPSPSSQPRSFTA